MKSILNKVRFALVGTVASAARAMRSVGTPAGIADTNSAINAAVIERRAGAFVPALFQKDNIIQEMKSNSKLARRLLYLPLDLGEKVLLWLTFRGLKPVSEITIVRRNFPELRRQLRSGKRKIEKPNKVYLDRIKTWLEDADLAFIAEPDSITWHIGKDKAQVEQSAKILHRQDYQSKYQSGVLFGFPKESAKAYAANSKLGKDKIPMVWFGQISSNPYLKDKYYSPYIFYSMRADRLKNDSQIAKKWADTIRTEAPMLAQWYEKSVHKRWEKEAKVVKK